MAYLRQERFFATFRCRECTILSFSQTPAKAQHLPQETRPRPSESKCVANIREVVRRPTELTGRPEVQNAKGGALGQRTAQFHQLSAIGIQLQRPRQAST